MPKKKCQLPAKVKNILFITLSNIGDVILSTPTLEALHLRYPHAVIDIVGDDRSKIIFKHCSYVGKFYEKDKKLGWYGVFLLLRKLRITHYDIAVDLRTDGLLFFIRSKCKIFKLPNNFSLSIHSAKKHFYSIRAISDKNMPHPKIWLSEKEQSVANMVLSRTKGKKILAIGLGANFNGKIWPTNSFVNLANKLNDYFDFVLLLGNKEDARKSPAFIEHYSKSVIDCAGHFTLLETAALLKKSDFFIGNDSGLGHMASALGIPSFTIFGVGNPSKYRPWGVNALWHQDPNQDITAITASLVSKKIIKRLKMIS
jgi:heptosyltransferase III